MDTIASYGPSVFANITSTINSESSLLGSVGSTMGSMMSSLSVFSGAGTILGPLISMAGPGIMVTVMSMIASVVMSTVLTPLFSNFTSTVLQDDLNTLMAPLGGTSTGALAMLDNIASLMSVTSQPGVTSQDSGSGYIAQSTGTSVGTTGSLSSTGSSSGTCNITAIGTCLAPEFNDLLLLSQTLLNDTNGAFSTFINVAGELLTAMETLTGSTPAPATAVTAPTKTIATSVTSATSTTPSTSWFALELGGLSIVKDLLGYLRAGESNKEEQLSTQWIRFGIVALQFLESIYYRQEYPSTSSSYLWFVKTLVSGATISIGLLNDMNSVAEKSYLTSFANSLQMNNFNEAAQELKFDAQLFGAITFAMYMQEHFSSLSASADLFMVAYFGIKLIKIILFIEKFGGSQDPGIISLEQKIYVGSAGLNVAQMILTIAGIG